MGVPQCLVKKEVLLRSCSLSVAHLWLLLSFHCPAHRLDLAIQDIAKKVLELRNPQCRKVANRRTNLYLRLNNSLEMPTNSISTLRKGRRAYNTQHYGGIRNQLRNSSQH